MVAGAMAESAVELKLAGNEAFAEGDFDAAIGHYSKAIDIDPNSAALYSNRAAAYTQIKYFHKAERDADRCIVLRPEWTKGYWRKGVALMEQREYRKAINAFEMGLEYNPSDLNLVEAKRWAVEKASVVDRVIGEEHGVYSEDSSRTTSDLPPRTHSGWFRDSRRFTAQSRRSTMESRKSVKDSTQSFPDNRKMSTTSGIVRTSVVTTGESGWPGSMEEEITRILGCADHYSILKVPMVATNDQLKRNYRVLARLLHPDKCQLPRGEEAMKSVSIAYEVLANESKRNRYDMYMRGRVTTNGIPETFTEWEAKQRNSALPKWIVKMLEAPGCVIVVAIIALIVLFPLLLIAAIIYIIFYLIWVFPRELVLSCCFPDKWEEYKERREQKRRKAEEKMDERMQDEIHARV